MGDFYKEVWQDYCESQTREPSTVCNPLTHGPFAYTIPPQPKLGRMDSNHQFQNILLMRSISLSATHFNGIITEKNQKCSI